MRRISGNLPFLDRFLTPNVILCVPPFGFRSALALAFRINSVEGDVTAGDVLGHIQVSGYSL